MGFGATTAKHTSIPAFVTTVNCGLGLSFPLVPCINIAYQVVPDIITNLSEHFEQMDER